MCWVHYAFIFLSSSLFFYFTYCIIPIFILFYSHSFSPKVNNPAAYKYKNTQYHCIPWLAMLYHAENCYIWSEASPYIIYNSSPCLHPEFSRENTLWTAVEDDCTAKMLLALAGVHSWSEYFLKTSAGHPSGPGALPLLSELNFSNRIAGLMAILDRETSSLLSIYLVQACCLLCT